MRLLHGFNPLLASVGLITGVALSWALGFSLGRFDSTWMLAGFLALGLGMLALNLLARLAGGAEDEDESVPEPEPESQTVPEVIRDEPEEEPAVGPHLRVLVTSAGLEALAVALFIGYYSGSVLASLAAGVVVGGSTIAISMLLARRFSTAT